MFYLVECGLIGEPGCFSCGSARILRNGTRVIVRTERGVEVGRVVREIGGDNAGLPVAGKLLRPMSPNDRLIAERLERFRQRAVEACSELVQRHGSRAVLMDAEQLFDGETLVFHFLGPVDASLDPVLESLAALYEQKIRFRPFAERLASGCGPDCGTALAGCSTGGCGSCGSAGGCGSRAKSGGS